MMQTKSGEKMCVILLGMGGPDSLDDIPEFLYNIFSDRSIIRLPGPAWLQRPFARMISRLRSGSVKGNYSLIGGGSPLLKWTRSQADQIEDELSSDIPGIKCYIGMRYFRPTIQEAIKQAHIDGFTDMCFLPMYPQFSTATTGSSFSVAKETGRDYPDSVARFIKDFHDDADYTALLKKYIDANIAPGETLLFSAHSLPQKFVDEGDPYVDQIRRTAEMAAGDREYFLSFQSRTGPVKWVGPDTVEETKRLLEEREGGLFVVPISFICDHIETLFELDIELKELMGKEAEGRIRRMPMFNDDPDFARVLANLVRQTVGASVKN